MMKLPAPSPALRPKQVTASGDETVDESYRLISIDAAQAPEGCTGRDWFNYRIAQGMNRITGFRSGTVEQVTAEVEEIVTALNVRRGSFRKPESKKGERRTTPTD